VLAAICTELKKHAQAAEAADATARVIHPTASMVSVFSRPLAGAAQPPLDPTKTFSDDVAGISGSGSAVKEKSWRTNQIAPV
jgi:hypothetical protein